MRTFMMTFMLVFMFLLATAFSFASGEDQRNYLVIGFLYFCPAVFLLSTGLHRRAELLFYLFFAILVLAAVQHMDLFRFSTLAYTWLFITAFICYERFLQAGALPEHAYVRLLRVIIVAYCVTLVIQQICLLVGLPVFNMILSSVDEGKLNALAPEPSHAARILPFTMLSYLLAMERADPSRRALPVTLAKDRLVWFCFAYAMLGIGSALSIITLAVFLIRYLSAKNIVFTIILAATLLFIVGRNSLAVERTISFLNGVVTMDPDALLAADHSGAMRVVPAILYVNLADPGDIDFWFGAGCDYNTILFPAIVPGVAFGTGIGSLFPTLFMNYGFLAGVLFCFICWKYCLRRFLSLEMALLVATFLGGPINTQVTWYGLVLLSSDIYFAGLPRPMHSRLPEETRATFSGRVPSASPISTATL